MSTFSGWLTSIQKKPEPRQITWVCGPEVVLVEEVVRYVVDYLGPEPWNLVTLVAGLDSERLVWSSLDQHPMGTSPRVVVVRHAENLTDWDRFILWVKNRARNPRTYVVMVSAEAGVPKTEPTPEQRRAGGRPSPVPHIAAIGSKGHVVECKPFTSATAVKSVEWVQSKAKMRDGVARHLLTRANWDLRRVRDTCQKLAVFPDEVTISVVNALLAEQPRDTFTDALLALDRRTALLALETTDTDDIGRIIGLLDYRLEQAARIYDMVSDHKSPGDMAKSLGAQAFLLGDLLKVSKHYDTKRRMEIRRILAMADAAHRAGEATGVLEAVVILW